MELLQVPSSTRVFSMPLTPTYHIACKKFE